MKTASACPTCRTALKVEQGANDSEWLVCSNAYCQTRGADGQWSTQVSGRGSVRDSLTSRQRRALCAGMWRELVALGLDRARATELVYFCERTSNSRIEFLRAFETYWTNATRGNSTHQALYEALLRLDDDYERAVDEEYEHDIANDDEPQEDPITLLYERLHPTEPNQEGLD
jgi:hypothetical protein